MELNCCGCCLINREQDRREEEELDLLSRKVGSAGKLCPFQLRGREPHSEKGSPGEVMRPPHYSGWPGQGSVTTSSMSERMSVAQYLVGKPRKARDRTRNRAVSAGPFPASLSDPGAGKAESQIGAPPNPPPAPHHHLQSVGFRVNVLLPPSQKSVSV